jgi:hypothetical protein
VLKCNENWEFISKAHPVLQRCILFVVLNGNTGIAVTQTNNFYCSNSQHISVCTGHHQVILRHKQLATDYVNYNHTPHTTPPRLTNKFRNSTVRLRDSLPLVYSSRSPDEANADRDML